jgi:hypothetical protein
MSIEFLPFDTDRSSLPRGTGRRPVSRRRLAANRANARKSTGPRTAAGKRRVSRNAIKHGLCAMFGARLPSESDATFSVFINELEEDLRPRTTLQNVLFPQIANLLWRLERLPQAQADIFTEELPKAAKRGGETLSPAQILARRFSDDRNNGFILLDRYERTMRNALLRLLKQFDQLAKRTQSDDPDDRVPREGDRPAWTIEQQRAQEQAFERRREALERHEPPANEYEAAIDRAITAACGFANPPAPPPQRGDTGGAAKPQADNLHSCDDDARERAGIPPAKQTQTNPIETVNSTSPKPKCPTLQPSPVTEQSHPAPPGPAEM